MYLGPAATVVETTSGEIWACGDNRQGQLGLGGPETRAGLRQLTHWTHGPLLSGALGGQHTLFLDQNGVVHVSGWHLKEVYSIMTPVKDLPPIHQIAAGAVHSVALDQQGDLWTWPARDVRSQISLGHQGEGMKLHRLESLPPMRRVACGNTFTMAEACNGSLWGWGSLLGGHIAEFPTPTMITVDHLESPLRSLACGKDFILLVDAIGQVFTTGDNRSGQLGGHRSSLTKPNEWYQVQGLPPIRSVVTGSSHVIAMDEEDRVWVWGEGRNGALGAENQIHHTPIRSPLLDGAVHMAAGGAHSMISNRDGQIFVLGSNTMGELGLNDLYTRLQPTLHPLRHPAVHSQRYTRTKSARSTAPHS